VLLKCVVAGEAGNAAECAFELGRCIDHTRTIQVWLMLLLTLAADMPTFCAVLDSAICHIHPKRQWSCCNPNAHNHSHHLQRPLQPCCLQTAELGCLPLPVCAALLSVRESRRALQSLLPLPSCDCCRSVLL
jgi:hypothetical protein